MRTLSAFSLFLCSLPAVASSGAIADPTMTSLIAQYVVIPDITYLRADNMDLTLDVYVPVENIRETTRDKSPIPTLIFIHGGGWIGGRKDRDVLQLLPYLNDGWAVVNVEYRLAEVALAPAAVEDVRCAVWWVKRNSKQYGFDPQRIVLTGRSAGAHLALIAGMLPASAGLDGRCPATEEPDPSKVTAMATFPELQVAAIVNWAGITDVADLIEGPNVKNYAVAWMGAMQERQAIAQRVSPMNYVRSGLPAIITLHGDQDAVVPYDHAIRLHKALDEASVPNELHTLKGRHHFIDFSEEDIQQAFEAIGPFLEQYVRH